jgi:hypothetical protein
MSDEVSQSIEEANRLRASLGLSLLAPSSKDAQNDAAQASVKQTRDAMKQHELKEAQREQKEAARKKALKEKTSGPGLGQILTEQKGSAADWVERMRKIGDPNAERQKALRLAQELERQDSLNEPQSYESKDLAGLKVRHDAHEFEKGTTEILTLQDSFILKDGGHADNDVEDELENVNMKSIQFNKRDADRKKKQLGYNPHEESNELLPHYSEEKDYTGNMRLDADGKFDEAQQLRMENEAKAAQAREMKQVMYNLNTVDAQPEPSLPVTFKKKKKKVKEAGPSSKEDMYSFLKEPSLDDRTKDHGKRADLESKRLAKLEEDRKRQLKDQSYLRALERAEERQQATANLILDEDDLDPGLESSLGRARRARLLAKKEKVKLDPATRMLQDLSSAGSGIVLKSELGVKIKTEPGLADEASDEDDKPAVLSVSRTTNFCAALSLVQKVKFFFFFAEI